MSNIIDFEEAKVEKILKDEAPNTDALLIDWMCGISTPQGRQARADLEYLQRKSDRVRGLRPVGKNRKHR